MSSGTIVAIVVPISVAVVIFIVGICCLCKRIRNKYDSECKDKYESECLAEKKYDSESAIGISNLDSLQYDFRTIEAATNKFSTKIGTGYFGDVFKGTLLNGQEIAVKRLSTKSIQGMTEFKNEVDILAKVQHKNIVRLLGFCVQREEKILLYEFVTNSSLDRILYDSKSPKKFDWANRYKIVKEIAQGIQYLHNDSRLRFIHRDLKLSNILLDSDMNPKISDFGMALFFPFDQTPENTSGIVGTFGYMAPEYTYHGDFSIKSDVYSFGIILMEIISRRIICAYKGDEPLMSRAWGLWKKGEALGILDPAIRESSNPSEVMRCIHTALLCVQQDPEDRPSMSSVVIMLENYSMALPTPLRPAFCEPSDDSKPTSDNEMSDSEVIPQ